MSTAPATMAPKNANRCSQPRIRGRVSGCSQSLSSKSAAVQTRSTRSPSSRTAVDAPGARGASSSASSASTRTVLAVVGSGAHVPRLRSRRLRVILKRL